MAVQDPLDAVLKAKAGTVGLTGVRRGAEAPAWTLRTAPAEKDEEKAVQASGPARPLRGPWQR